MTNQRTKKNRDNKKIIRHKKKIYSRLKRGGATTKKIITLRCSPKKGKLMKYSCFNDKTLFKLRDLWNLRHTDVRIETNDPKEIWKHLQKNMSNICNKESCWIKQQFTNGELDNELTDSFAPLSPKEWKKNPNEWLTSTDILSVMKQHEDAYPCFDFIGPSPIDFDTRVQYGECVWQELCDFNIEKQMKAGKTKIGIIFNLDPHTKGGSHWVSMFIHLKKGKIFFFDSVGDPAPKEILRLVKRIQKQGLQLKTPIRLIFDQNHPNEHQYGDTECGMYSLYFIVHMLEDKHTAEYFKTHVLPDKYMESFRKIYFNEEL
uniref:Ubiquitin-like protease family profile domain-containing protein n=1 Tax=viral metagenome TaxID=1070528 RepID=A0A6C0LBV1_9ZZZZ